MAIEHWVSGNTASGLTWTTCMLNAGASLLNSMANGAAVMDSTDVTNGTGLDIYADFSIQMGPVTTVAPAQMAVFIYPLNGDGATYGDGQINTTSAAHTPAPQLYVGNIQFPVAAALSGVGMIERIVLPPGTFRWVVQCQLGATANAAGANAQFRTYNRAVA
jgi:hypothetical protein